MANHVLIVEDHKILRKSLREWLGGIFPHCDFYEAASGEEAIEICRDLRPDLILMDIGLPRLNGIGTAKQVLSKFPKTQIVILTIHEEDAYRSEAMSAGASAFVLKREMKTELVPTMKRLLAV